MVVAHSDPGVGHIVFDPPTDFVVRFSFPVDETTLDASDLSVNGLPASTLLFNPAADPNRVTFQFTVSPVTAEGVQTMSMTAGVVTTNSTVPPDPNLRGWTADFRYDALLMGVTSTSPVDGETVALPMTTLAVTLNEPYDPNSADIGDLVLNQGTVIGVDTSSPQTVKYTLSGII